MRIANDENDEEWAQRRWNQPTAARLAEPSTDSNNALSRAGNFGASGLRATLCWQIARTLFRIGFAGSLALFAGRLIEDGTFDMIGLAGALVCLALSSCAGVFADLRAASA